MRLIWYWSLHQILLFTLLQSFDVALALFKTGCLLNLSISTLCRNIWGSVGCVHWRHTSELSSCQFKLDVPRRCQLLSASHKPLCIDQSEPPAEDSKCNTAHFCKVKLTSRSTYSKLNIVTGLSWHDKSSSVSACMSVQYVQYCVCMHVSLWATVVHACCREEFKEQCHRKVNITPLSVSPVACAVLVPVLDQWIHV